MQNIRIRRLYKSNVFMVFFFTVLLIIARSIIVSGFAIYAQIANIFVIASFLGLIALAQTIVMVIDGGIDISVGALMLVSTVLVADIALRMEGGMWIGIILSLIICMALGFVNGLITVYLKISPIIITLAMASVITGLMLVYSNGFPQGMSPLGLQNFVYGRVFNVPSMLILWIAVTAIILFISRKTKLGRLVYGVGSNRLTAELSGAKTRLIRATSYAISGLVCGFTGIFFLGYVGVPNNLEAAAANYILPSIAAVVIGGVSLTGGKGSYLGAVGGALLLTTLDSLLMSMYIGTSIRRIIFGLVLVGILILYGRNKK